MQSQYMIVKFIKSVVFISALMLGNQLIASEDDSKTIEQTILWQSEAKDGQAHKIETLLKDKARFKAENNFYKVLVPLNVFGHKAKYIGIMGVELIPGPNAVLEGKPEAIAEQIAHSYGLQFQHNQSKTSFVARLKKRVKLIIEKHPGIAGASIVIGAYFGP